MATSRITGTNEQVTSYGTGKTYTALATWEVATDTNHVADAESDVLEVFDDGSAHDDNDHLDGSTNSSIYFRIIRAASGEGHTGVVGTGADFVYTGTAHWLRFREPNSSVQDLEVSGSTNSTKGRRLVECAAGDSNVVVGMLLFDGFDSGSGNIAGLRSVDPGTVAVNCLIHNMESGGCDLVSGNGETQTVYNCTITDCGTSNIVNNATGTGTAVCKNVLCDNPGTGSDFESGTYTGSDYNAASDTSDPDSGTNNRTSQTFTFVNSAGNDFHLASGDAGAKNFGVDLSGDGTFAFDDDIDGETITTWSIGFDSIIAAGGPIAALRTLSLTGVGL